MEFIKHDDPIFPTMGRYKHVFSSDRTNQFYFNTPAKFDSESKRWFSESGFTYCTPDGYAEEVTCDNLDIYHFWKKHPNACFRETYYEWAYQDESCSSANISYAVSEFSDGEYFQNEFTINDVTEEQFATMEQALMNWHRTGSLIIGDVNFILAYRGKNPNIHTVHKHPAINTAESIGNCLPVDQETVLMDLKARTTIQEELHNHIAETICRVYSDLQSQHADTPYDAYDVYQCVINDSEISRYPWLHKELEWLLTDPIPFA